MTAVAEQPARCRTTNLLFHAMEVLIGSQRAIGARELLLNQGAIIYQAGDEVREVYFPLSCLLAPQLPLDDGTMMATTLRGSEGAYGLLTAVRKARAPERCQVQIGGRALRIGSKELRRIFQGHTEVRNLFLSYWDAVMYQYEQMAICNATHSVHARLSRCLLEIYDRVGDAFPLTHQHLADLIGVNRTTVSLLVLSFRRSGLIETNRAHVRITDRKRLLVGTCDCYHVIGKKFAIALALN